MDCRLNILFHKILKALRAFFVLLGKIKLNTIAHEDCICSFFEEFHESPCNREWDNSKDYGHKHRWLYLIVVRRYLGNEEITNYTANRNNKGSSNVDKKLSCSMAYEELCCTSHHQVKRFSCRSAEIFTSNSNHNVSILGDKSYNSLKAGNQASRTFNKEANSPSFGHSKGLLLKLILH